MISRKKVYDLMVRLEDVSDHVSRKERTLSLGSISDDLQYSISYLELTKSLSSLELAILGQSILNCFQKECIESSISISRNELLVVVMNSNIGSSANHSQMAIALLECLVKFKELEANQNAA